MDYIELECVVEPLEPFAEIVMARLGDSGFDMFEDTESGLKAYIEKNRFDESILKEFDDLLQSGAKIEFTQKVIPWKNWNEEWESNFEPVTIADKIYIRAAFHPESDRYPYTILIQPKMAFGTGHHATTFLVMETMLQYDISGKSVLDMGCGTAILSILAHKLGASEISAIDNDEIAVENAKENCRLNGAEDIHVQQGDVSSIQNTFDIVLANINRNIILNDLNAYVKSMNDDGLIILSGFYIEDADAITKAAFACGLKPEKNISKDRWACLTFKK